jgi:PAS domain S-box-containing protein
MVIIIAVAMTFLLLFNLMVLAALWLSYRTSSREYLKIGCFAGAVQMLSYGTDLMLLAAPDSMTVELLFQVFQFGATLMFVAALLMVSDRVTRFYYFAFAVLGVGLLVSLVHTLLNGIPQDVVGQYRSSLPLFALTTVLFWRALRTGSRFTLGRLFLILASFSMLLLRLILPTIPMGLISGFVYFLEYLTFTVMLIALLLYELEFANAAVEDLLLEKTQSEQDLEFIVNNSLDIILVSDAVGLLQSWSTKAREVFGYSREQAVGKIHMDDLFASNYWGRGLGTAEEFQSKMETVDGEGFMVEVRMREVFHHSGAYHVFVLRLSEET